MERAHSHSREEEEKRPTFLVSRLRQLRDSSRERLHDLIEKVYLPVEAQGIVLSIDPEPALHRGYYVVHLVTGDNKIIDVALHPSVFDEHRRKARWGEGLESPYQTVGRLYTKQVRIRASVVTERSLFILEEDK